MWLVTRLGRRGCRIDDNLLVCENHGVGPWCACLYVWVGREMVVYVNMGLNK